jgi:hypothetical protein
LCKILLLSRFHTFHGYEILWACTYLTLEQEYERFISYLPQKLVFLASKTLLSLSGIGGKLLLFNFECYDLINGKERMCKIW